MPEVAQDALRACRRVPVAASPRVEIRRTAMANTSQEVLADVGELPPVGTLERLEWDLTIRQANELYPDWASINIGRARFKRETYEQDYKEYYTKRGGSRRSRPRRPNPTALPCAVP
jgi:hypothetical protein